MQKADKKRKIQILYFLHSSSVKYVKSGYNLKLGNLLVGDKAKGE